MMNDKELLERAAKAGGVVVIRSRLDDPMNKDFLVKNGNRNESQEAGPWNPLTDDGDAFRLLVDRQFNIVREFDRVEVHDQNGQCCAVEYIYDKPTPTDPRAATRRAIVRAAAALVEGE